MPVRFVGVRAPFRWWNAWRRTDTFDCIENLTVQFNVVEHLVSIFTDSQNQKQERSFESSSHITMDHMDGPFSSCHDAKPNIMHCLAAVHWGRGRPRSATKTGDKEGALRS
jgi:hypothetical protein